jgi:acetyltransferase-like isoleucine patch superfamily enzyme
MGAWQELKELWWDIRGRRFLYWQAFYAPAPAQLGRILRRRLYRKWLKSLGRTTHFHEGVYIRNPHKLAIGENCHIGFQVRIQAGGGVTLGDGVILGPGVSIWSSNHVFANPDIPVFQQGQEFKEVIIEDDCWIGSNAFIMPGVYLGKGSIVSAGAIVGAKRYKEYSILAGNPARVIGFRNQRPDTPTTDKP